jgi:cytochrome c556
MWDHHYDPGYYEVAKILQKDMASLDKIGLDGMISCQLQRIAFPTNLPMYCMVKTLWNKNETFEGIAKEYYHSAYGEYADAVEEYMSTLSKLFVPEVLRGEKPYDAKEMTEKYEQAKQVVKEFENNYILKLKENSKLWKYLFHHAQIVKIYADVYIARFNGNEDECKAKAQEIYDYAISIRTFTDTVLDDNFLRGDVYNNLFGWRKTI